MLKVFNKQGGFDNLDDTEDALRTMLGSAFEQVTFETMGSVAVFAAMGPKVPPAAG